ncbi:MAG: 30S ribosomal protein S20 [Oscillospiraceae bacterium]
MLKNNLIKLLPKHICGDKIYIRGTSEIFGVSVTFIGGGGKRMPNIKSAAKRDRTAKVRNAQNRSVKTLLRTDIKKFDAAIAEGDHETAVSAYKVAVKAVDQAAAKHLIHKNCAANKKSKLTLKLNGLAQ